MTSLERVKPWHRPSYKEWRRKYEKSEKFRAIKREYFRKLRLDPIYRAQFNLWSWRWRVKNRLKYLSLHAIKRAQKTGVPYSEAALNALHGAKPDKCDACGGIFDYEHKGKNKRPHNLSPSIDRIDSSKGYVEGNIGIICWRCNAIKRDARVEELEAIAKYMRRHANCE